MRTPSISTSVWPLFAPRRNTPETRAGAAVLHDLDARLALQELGEAQDAGAGDLLGADHRDVGEHVGDRLRLPRRGDRDRIEARRARRDRLGRRLAAGSDDCAREQRQGATTNGSTTIRHDRRAGGGSSGAGGHRRSPRHRATPRGGGERQRAACATLHLVPDGARAKAHGTCRAQAGLRARQI